MTIAQCNPGRPFPRRGPSDARAVHYALAAAKAGNDVPEAMIPADISPLMRAALVKALRQGGFQRAEVRKIYDGHTHRRYAWCARGTAEPVNDLVFTGLVRRKLAVIVIAHDRADRARLTLMGQWFAETLEAQWHRGEFHMRRNR